MDASMKLVDNIEAAFLNSLSPAWNETYHNALAQGNPHSKHFPLMNPVHAVLTVVAYLIIVYVGQIVMRNRKEFKLYYFSLFHNAMMVTVNGYICYETIRLALRDDFTLFGNGVDTSINGLPMARVLWLFYFTKPVEFIDTFIMVLKKNNRQISFLHVYHHISTFLIWWGVIYYVPGGDSYFSAAQNAFIHVLMYSYYFLASLKVPCPWKKYLTQAQMLQFLLNAAQSVYVLYYDTAYPKFWAKVLLSFMVTLLILFGNFYVKSNSRPAARPQKKVE